MAVFSYLGSVFPNKAAAKRKSIEGNCKCAKCTSDVHLKLGKSSEKLGVELGHSQRESNHHRDPGLVNNPDLGLFTCHLPLDQRRPDKLTPGCHTRSNQSSTNYPQRRQTTVYFESTLFHTQITD